MKIVRRFLLICSLSMPLFLVPKQSHAGVIGDVLGLLFGNSQTPNCNQAPNSVPLDGGVVFLLMAGLGLGIVMLLRAKSKSSEVASA